MAQFKTQSFTFFAPRTVIFIKKAVEVPVIPKKVCRLVPVIVKNNLI